jgi:hypothetical protein
LKGQIFSSDFDQIDEQKRPLFNIKLLQDASLAHTLEKILLKSGDFDQYFVLTSPNQMEYGFGFLSRIFAKFPILKNDTLTVTSKGLNLSE